MPLRTWLPQFTCPPPLGTTTIRRIWSLKYAVKKSNECNVAAALTFINGTLSGTSGRSEVPYLLAYNIAQYDAIRDHPFLPYEGPCAGLRFRSFCIACGVGVL